MVDSLETPQQQHSSATVRFEVYNQKKEKKEKKEKGRRMDWKLVECILQDYHDTSNESYETMILYAFVRRPSTFFPAYVSSTDSTTISYDETNFNHIIFFAQLLARTRLFYS